MPTPVVGACSVKDTVEVTPASKPYHSSWKVQPTCGVLLGIESTSPCGATFTVPLLPGAAVAAPGTPATMRVVRAAAERAAEVRMGRMRMFT